MESKSDPKTTEFKTIEDVLKNINEDINELESVVNKYEEKAAIKFLTQEINKHRQYIRTITEEILLRKYM